MFEMTFSLADVLIICLFLILIVGLGCLQRIRILNKKHKECLKNASRRDEVNRCVQYFFKDIALPNLIAISDREKFLSLEESVRKSWDVVKDLADAKKDGDLSEADEARELFYEQYYSKLQETAIVWKRIESNDNVSTLLNLDFSSEGVKKIGDNDLLNLVKHFNEKIGDVAKAKTVDHRFHPEVEGYKNILFVLREEMKNRGLS